MMLFLYFAFWVTYQCISLLEEVSYFLCDSFTNILFSLPDLVPKPACQIAEMHADTNHGCQRTKHAHAAVHTTIHSANAASHTPKHAPDALHRIILLSQWIVSGRFPGQ